VTHVIAGGIGDRARSLYNELSIRVIAGAHSDEAAALVQQFLTASLRQPIFSAVTATTNGLTRTELD
jgi:hypothetical protein